MKKALAILLVISSSCWGQVKKKTAMLDQVKKNGINLVHVAIIGSGPAGLSAGICAARSGFHTVIFEGPKPGGQLMSTTYVENWPGIMRSLGPTIIEKMEKQAEHFGALLTEEIVERVDLGTWPFKLYTSHNREIEALTVIAATGNSPRKLGVPGEDKYLGKGVMSCAICDSPFTKDSVVAVVGGNGETVIEQVLQLAVYAKEIIVLIPQEQLNAPSSLQEELLEYPHVQLEYNKKVKAIKGDDSHVTHLEVADMLTGKKEQIGVDWAFLAIGQDPNSMLFKGQLELDKRGYIKLRCHSQQTSKLGVFAAGNVSDPSYRQGSVASADGTKAALDAIKFLRNQVELHESSLALLKDTLYKPKVRQKNTSCITAISTKEDFKKALSSKNLVVMEIYSTSCPDCKRMFPIVEAAAAQYKNKVDFVKVSVPDAGLLIKQLKISSVPTLICWHNKKVISQTQGIMPQEKLTKIVEATLDSLKNPIKIMDK